MKKILIIILLIITTVNLSAQWTQVASNIHGYDIIDHNGTLYLAGTNGVYKSPDAINWTLIDNGLTTPSNIKEAFKILAEGNTLYVATTDGIFKSIDDGANWIKKSNGITIGNGANVEFTMSINRIDGVLYTGANTGIYRSVDHGENWSLMHNADGYVSDFVKHNNIIFAARNVGNSPYSYKSIDNGITWSDLFEPSPTNSYFSESGKLWAATAFSGVWLSTDDGLNWENRSNGLSGEPYIGNIIRVDGVLLVTDFIITRSFDNGLNWEYFGEGLPPETDAVDYKKIITFNNTLLVIGDANVWQRDTSQIVSVSDVNTQLFSFKNYPNPFANSTTISLSIPEKSKVEINIYNIQGQKISKLINKDLNSGEHNIIWNRTNDQGKYVSSGVYFCELIVNNKKVKTLKYILE